MQSCGILVTWRSALQTVHVSPQRLLPMALSPSRAACCGGIEKVKVSKVDPPLSSQGHPLWMRTGRFWCRMGWQVLGPGLFPATGTLLWRGSCVCEREGRLAHVSSVPHHTISGYSLLLYTTCFFSRLSLLLWFQEEAVSGFIVCSGTHFLYSVGGWRL